MLIGQYSHNLDSKGRLAMPVKFRSELGSSAIVTKGLDACLFVYPKAQWETMAAKISSLPISNPKARSFARHMLSGAMEVEIDKLGRMVIPGYLRDFSGLSSETVVSGVYDRVELWNKKAWEDYKSKSDADVDGIAEELGDLGI